MQRWMRVLLVSSVLALTSSEARAEWFVFPFAAANAGGDTTRESGAYGGSFGWTGRWFGAEAEATWSPDFFDGDGGFRTRHEATTYAGTALAGALIGSWRPYGSLGIGVLRSEIEEVGGLASLADSRAALHIGIGLMWAARARLSLRGDVRYVRALEDMEPEGNVFGERLGEFGYCRAGGGLVVRW